MCCSTATQRCTTSIQTSKCEKLFAMGDNTVPTAANSYLNLCVTTTLWRTRMKQPAKPTTERPKALDVLVDVTELALTYKYPGRRRFLIWREQFRLHPVYRALLT